MTRASSRVPSAVCSARATSPSPCTRATRSPRSYGTQHVDLDLPAAAARASISCRQLVDALAGAAPRRRPSAARGAAAGRATSGSAASVLLITMISGTCVAPISASTSRTAAICASGSASDPSTTCSIRSASATSSSVERNASTSWCGRWRTKPTVSVSGVDAPVGGRLRPAYGRVEGREQRVLDQHARAGEPVEQRGLAGVGVAGDRDRRAPRGGAAPRAWCRGRSSSPRSRGAAWPSGCGSGAGRSRSWSHRDHAPPMPPPPAAGHRPAGTATHPSRAAAAACTASAPARPAPCPPGSGVLGEDVEDQRGPVDDLDLDDVLELAQLAGASARRRR